MGASGTPVPQGFEYHSGNNPQFLSPAEIAAFNRAALLEIEPAALP